MPSPMSHLLSVECLLCSKPSVIRESVLVLSKHKGQLFECDQCGLVFLDKPTWLKEAYSQAISRLDTGIVYRNLQVASLLSVLIPRCLENSTGPYLDFSGGHGLLVRLMRDCHFDFYWTDAFADNLFAQGFESLPKHHYELATAIEAFEHFPDPFQKFTHLFSLSKNIFLTTTLMPDQCLSWNDWPYYQPNTGQHITFYRKRTLDWVAEKFQKKITSHRDLHWIGDDPPTLSQLKRWDWLSRKLPVYKWAQKKRGSLIAADAQTLQIF